MNAVTDSPVLARLERLDAPRGVRRPAGVMPSMGYQPGLDGVRALSVVAVILYHAGFEWMHGGFYGVEVFFVVSGFLITSLLVEEHERDGSIRLGQFWLRRFRRLLPALFTMLVAVGVWAAIAGSADDRTALRRDYLWSIGYLANWGQVVNGASYFESVSPLRHLWSLAVEEQWYVIWPLICTALVAIRRRPSRAARGIAVVAVAIIAVTWWLARSPEITDDRTNVLYLSTVTRATGLLLGAAAAFVWRPWRSSSVRAGAGRVLDIAGGVGIAVLVASFIGGSFGRSVFRWNLPLVTVAALVVVLVAVHPASQLVRRSFAAGPLVAVGKRSYGLYLWSWPVSVFVGATTGSPPRFVAAMAITAAVSEFCYRFLEQPIRRGVIGRWWRDRQRADWRTIAGCAAVSTVALLVPLVVKYVSVQPVDRYADTSGVTASLDREALLGVDATVSAEPAAGATPATGGAPPATAASLPRRLVVVGDSQANALVRNLPDGTSEFFSVSNGAVEGCGVFDDGAATAPGRGTVRTFSNCADWREQWVSAAQAGDAELALVVIGAWDVFDLDVDGVAVPFASDAWDSRFVAGVQSGIDALAAEGVHVALLEVPCMRPIEAEGQGQAPLMQRGDDTRVGHLNELLRSVADSNAGRATFVAGPMEWCTDEAIATDPGYRWDGVHVYIPGATLIIDAIAPALLAIPL